MLNLLFGVLIGVAIGFGGFCAVVAYLKDEW